MRWKTTFVLLVLTIGIGAYVSLYELKQPSPEQAERRAREVVRVPADSVARLAIELPQSKVSLQRLGSGWRLAPRQVRANAARVERILRSLDPLSSEERLPSTADHPLDLKTFGLHPPVGSITLTARGAPATLLIGDPTSVGRNRYVQLAGRPEIFVIEGHLFDEANQPLDEFRDRQLLQFDPSAATGLVVASAAASFTLTHQDAWDLVLPLRDRGDRAEISKLLSALRTMKIQRFVDDAPKVEQLATWGLDHPKAEVQLAHVGEPPAAVTLFFGGPLADNAALVYAKRSDEPSLYAVSASDIDALLRDPQGLRAKECFDLAPAAATQVEVVRNKVGWRIALVEGRWRASGDNTALDEDRVGQFLGKLADVRLSGFVEDDPKDLARYGLAEPADILLVWTGRNEQPQRLLIGKTVEGSTNRYGRIEGRSAVVRLPDTVTELLTMTVESLRPPDKRSSK